ncbi:hypothetical protein FACS1894127_7730 [Clostridia bacterium]|nr:hypothetical protein FACS1894127_7730 [Clostridia bacterium]
MYDWKMVRLESIIDETITGEWGTECEDASMGTKVLRTTNFTNSGVINYDSVVVRNILSQKIEKKKLLENDIVLEKSGGSDNQPVGRVVFFDNKNPEIFLCNNFTQILRVDKNKACARFIFWYLFYLHKNGTTESLQNKTTGIRNLQVKRYMAMPIPLPPLTEQQEIATVFDKVDNLILRRKQQLGQLDLMVKSRFVEIFGDVISNDRGWKQEALGEFTDVGSSKRIFEREYVSIGIPFYRTKEIVDLSNNRQIGTPLFISDERFDEISRRFGSPQREDLLISAVGTIGTIWVVDNDKPFYFKDGNLLWVRNAASAESIYLKIVLERLIAYYIGELSAGSAYSALTIVKLKQMAIPLPPLDLQTRFADFVRQTDKSKLEIKRGLKQLELQYNALMQQYFER